MTHTRFIGPEREQPERPVVPLVVIDLGSVSIGDVADVHASCRGGLTVVVARCLFRVTSATRKDSRQLPREERLNDV